MTLRDFFPSGVGFGIAIFIFLAPLLFFFTFYDMRLSSVSRVHLAESLSSMRDDNSSAKYSVQYLRPSVRGVILNISARERIPPEYARAVLAGCLKLGALKTVVFTIPTKDRGGWQVCYAVKKCLTLCP